MKTLLLLTILAFVVYANALPTPEAFPQPIPVPYPGNRVARADSAAKEDSDLKGSESAYVAYPYVWGYHYPYVLVGK